MRVCPQLVRLPARGLCLAGGSRRLRLAVRISVLTGRRQQGGAADQGGGNRALDNGHIDPSVAVRSRYHGMRALEAA